MKFSRNVFTAVLFLFVFGNAHAQKREVDKVIYNAFIEKKSMEKLKENLRKMPQADRDELIFTTQESKLLRLQRKDNSVYYMIIYNDEGQPVELWDCFKSRADMMFTKDQLKEMGYEQGAYATMFNPKTNIKISSALRAIDGKNCECIAFTISSK